jgi:two-component system chemotaxis sensor kinase CheA
LNIEYRPLGGEAFERLLVVISDVTAVVAREASEQEGRDLVNLTKRLLKDRDGFLEFLDESRRLLERIHQNSGDWGTLKRDLHTLKGNTAVYGLQTVSKACHSLEDALESGATAVALDRSELRRHWERSLATVELLLGERSASKLQIDEKQYRALLDAIGRGASRRELEVMLKAWRLEPLRERLDRVAEQLVGVAARLGKGDVGVQIAAADLYLGREELSEFWTAFTHVVRNAADHGLLDARGRASAAAQGAADFGLRAGIDRDELFVELSDRGPGIDWESIRARANERGIPHTTQADLEEALFADGVSAKSEVTELSGRGVGLSAVRAACHKQRGTVQVTTGQGKGTSFRFSFPVSQFHSLVQLEAVAR